MANFAKSQLLKYGWTEGKGLGKNETGIPEAIRPKLKFDNVGIGHDSAEQFTYHWWENVFNEAAKNIIVKSDNDEVSMKVVDKDAVDVTTKKSSVKALKKIHGIQYGNFLKTSTLLNDGKVIEENITEPESMDSLAQKVNHVQLTDEDLFKACGGRTAHKGARHGLNLNGKLARIAEQEKELLAKMNLSKEEQSNDPTLSNSSGKKLSYDFGIEKSRKRVNNTGSHQSSLDDNANTIEQDDEFVIPPITKELAHRTKSKKSKRKDRRRINDLMAKLDSSCVIDESMKIAKKRRREEGQQIVEDISMENSACSLWMNTLQECNGSSTKSQKYKKMKTENFDCYAYDADKLNAKILRRKKNAHKKKRKGKLDCNAQSLNRDSISVNLDDICGEKTNTMKKELCQTLSDHETHNVVRAERRCHRHNSN